MSIADAVVVALGVALIVAELWFFLGPRKRIFVRKPHGDVQEIRVLVKAGYQPDVIPVEVGRPVRLLFYRDETDECSARIVFESLGIERELLPFKTTPVEFTPDRAGDYAFRCGMSVISGRVVAQLGREGARANLGKGHTKHA